MVGIYSLYTLGLGTGGPRYIWTIPIVVGLMLLVALVFGELASEYPLSGALYQYGKYCVGAALRLVHRMDLRVCAAGHRRIGRLGCRRLRRRPLERVVRHAFGSGKSRRDLYDRRRDHRALRHPQRHRREDHGARRALRRVRRDHRDFRCLCRAGDLRIPPTSRLHLLHAERRVCRTQSAALGFRRSLVDRRGAGRRARQRLHLLRLRIGRRHLGRDARSATPSAQSHAQRAALWRHRLVRPRTRAPARDACLRHRRRRQRRNQHDPRRAARLVARLLSRDGGRRVLQLRHRRSRRGRPRRLRAGARRSAARSAPRFKQSRPDIAPRSTPS